MSKVELSIKEYDDLKEATSKELNDKLELKRELIAANNRYAKLEERNVELLAKCMKISSWVWWHNFKDDIAITDDNLDDFVGGYIYEDYTREEVLKGVQKLYEQHFNKR